MANILDTGKLNWKPNLMILFILLLFTSFTQSGDQKTWDADSPLTWQDYKAVEKDKSFNSNTHSNTLVGEIHRYRRLKSDSNSYQFDFQVKSVMIRSKSWVDPAYKTSALLAHEQLHFDISAYFAKKLLIALQNGTYSKDFLNEMQDIRHRLSIQRNTMENLYDERTVHSNDKLMQAKWSTYVHSILTSNESLEKDLERQP